ncbi:MAG: DEAD/DEAH box helicase family protein, partial [Selenomonadaceae bacterium]|nr:DEAD/DEAH box helicase family protein [Selenomonadaceae bacterium]
MAIKIKTGRAVKPTIYAYTTPGVSYHDGWIKIGYTEQEVDKRINQQSHTIDVYCHPEWHGDAIFTDGSGDTFTDKNFHAYLEHLEIQRKRGTEWFKTDGKTSEKHFNDFRANRGALKIDSVTPYNLRDEQNLAVEMTLAYWQNHAGGKFLWNAKPRFGKTLAVYDLCKRAGAQNILIVTNRPAIANSWYADYKKFFGNAEYLFVSRVDALKGEKFVLTREEYNDELINRDDAKCIEFVSLQDLKGSKYFKADSDNDKLREVAEINWDILVVDESHEGVDTDKTEFAFDLIKHKFTLHLSGTPFKALAKKDFPADAIFNWTYADEQSKKISWTGDDENPYAELPQLNLFTYKMSDIVADELKRGVEINGETVEYAFDLNEFFATDKGKFLHESSVDKFLDALTTQKKFPFSTDELRDELRHTLWLLNRVESARLLAAKLKTHPVFGKYEIILAAGDGKTIRNEELGVRNCSDADLKNSFKRVTDAIKNFPRTITLSVGQLTTGVTIPEWTGVLMLANMTSPQLYIQATFRAQNPCLFQRDGKFLRKENAYVFDFDPARTLNIYETFANDLASNRADTLERRQKNIRELLNFFPVIGEDERGEMIELDAEEVLSVPRKIRSVEVVKRGFMSDFLFQNVFHVFNGQPEVVDIISLLPAVSESEIELPTKVRETAEKIHLDENGEVDIPQEFVIGQAQEIFGDKVFASTESTEQPKIKSVVAEILNTAKEHYGKDFSDKKTLETKLNAAGTQIVKHVEEQRKIEVKLIENERKTALKNSSTSGQTVAEINAEFDERKQVAEEKFHATLTEKINDFAQAAEKIVVETVETKFEQTAAQTVTDEVKAHLRGFARTIPSFLMAYGDENTTLANFDKIIPDEVFREVTSISLEQFRYLRDEGNLFDPVVFDDSVQEFLRLRKKLADYFDEGHDEDIFDYIPPQRTNQIFTPKDSVKFMADMLERESPGCFDDPEKTFIDPYMKSGLFVAEIVKRLYRSPALKKIFPDKAERLRH